MLCVMAAPHRTIDPPSHMSDSRTNGSTRRLSEIPVGGCAIVRAISGERFTTRRLMEMGLIPGTEVRVVRRAPMGDPIELRLRRFSLSIRRDDAATIEVEPRR
jgi:Fe2+ transport system protein FeoA